MNIVILSNNSIYKELFEKHEDIHHAFLWTSLTEETNEKENIDIVLLDGEIFELNQLGEVRERFPEKPIYYKPQELHSDLLMKNTVRLCSAYKVKALSEYTTIDQIVEFIINEVTNKEDYLSKRVVSFFGTHSGAGVSTTVLNLARSLSQKVKEKVLVLSLNSWDPSDYFYYYKGQYLNDLKVDLKTNNLTPVRLSEAIYKYETFYHLAGNRDIKMQRFYQPFEIKHLIDVAQQLADVILIDAGTHFDTAPTVQAYLSSRLRFLVTNQEEKGYRGYFPYVFHQLIEPVGGRTDDFLLIVNKYQPANSLINEKALEDELGMNRVVTLPDMGELGTMANYQKRLLYDLSESMYTKQVDLLSNVIISECKLQEVETTTSVRKEKRGLFALFK